MRKNVAVILAGGKGVRLSDFKNEKIVLKDIGESNKKNIRNSFLYYCGEI